MCLPLEVHESDHIVGILLHFPRRILVDLGKHLVLQSSRFVLCFFVSFWLSFPELKSTFQIKCSTKCALLRRSGAAFHLRRGVWTNQNPLESVVLPDSLEKHLWPRYPRKATARP